MDFHYEKSTYRYLKKQFDVPENVIVMDFIKQNKGR